MAQGMSQRDTWRDLVGVAAAHGELPGLMREITRHRALLCRSLGRDVGMAVAACDYLTNVRRRLREPRLIEADELRALTDHATTDELTGLYNRRAFERFLAREVERSRRYGAPGSLLLLDLDGFKGLNDRRGHAAGDRVLRYAAAVMCRHLRATDVPCRIGGDEFAIILCHTPLCDALAAAERIRADVAEAFTTAGVTVSAGAASFPEHASTPESLLACADRALYTAKHAGRNGTAAARA